MIKMVYLNSTPPLSDLKQTTHLLMATGSISQADAAKLTPASTASFDQFLDRTFDAGTGLMLTPGKPEKADLGRHCFSYCNLLAGEFYFQQAADAQPDGSAACGCNTPVADVLGLTK